MQDEGSIKFTVTDTAGWEVRDLMNRLQGLLGEQVSVLDVARFSGGFKIVFDTEDHTEEDATLMIVEGIAQIFPEAVVTN